MSEMFLAKLNALKFEAKVRKKIMEYFAHAGFLEVQTPPLQLYTSTEKYLYPFSTALQTLNGEEKQQLYLRFSSELALKKLLALGAEKIVELGWVFRNREDEDGVRHFPQFCMLEWNEINIGMDQFIEKLKRMLASVAYAVNGKVEIEQNGKVISLAPDHWQMMTVAEAFLKYAEIDFNSIENWDELIPLAKKMGGHGLENFDDAFNWVLLDKIEPELSKMGAVVLLQYPEPAASFAALYEQKKVGKAKTLPLAQRFEIYIAGVELANGFYELNDGQEQKKRMEENLIWLKKNKVENAGIDDDFLHAVDSMPVGCGAAMGFERWVMMLAGKNSLLECFPNRM